MRDQQAGGLDPIEFTLEIQWGRDMCVCVGMCKLSDSYWCSLQPEEDEDGCLLGHVAVVLSFFRLSLRAQV